MREPAQKLLTVADVAAYLGFDRDGHAHPELAVRRLLETNVLPGFKLPRRWRVCSADLERFMEDQLAAQGQGGVG